MVKGLFVGLTNLDYVYYINEYPKENMKCKTNEYSRYIGGPAANAAITYSLLGGDATLITAFGTSTESKIIEDELLKYNINIINLSKDDSLPGTSTICISDKGYRTIFSGQSVYKDFDFSLIPDTSFDFALFDCNQQDISLKVLEMVNCPVVLDAGSFKENTNRFLEKANIIISSENFKDDKDLNIFEMNLINSEDKAITRGDKSILTINGEIEVPKAECIDSLAAGDIFHGAFCFAKYNKYMCFEDALKFASEIASESVKFKGPRRGVLEYISLNSNFSLKG